MGIDAAVSGDKDLTEMIQETRNVVQRARSRAAAETDPATRTMVDEATAYATTFLDEYDACGSVPDDRWPIFAMHVGRIAGYAKDAPQP